MDNYQVINFHDTQKLKSKEIIIVCSIDPGIKNCGIYIGSYNIKTDESESLHISKRCFGKNWMKGCIEELSKSEEEDNLFSMCDYIVIESQLKVNYKTTLLMQTMITCLGMLTLNKGNKPLIIQISSQYKTRFFNCEPKKKGEKSSVYRRRIKKWASEKAMELIKEQIYKDFIISLKKKDDVCDSICQYFAWLKILQIKK
jgi:hypothetical protein